MRLGLDNEELTRLCEQRIGRPVSTAVFVRDATRSNGSIVYVLALDEYGVLWWLHQRPFSLGGWLKWVALSSLVVHTKPRRRGRYRLDLCSRVDGTLLELVIYGQQTEEFVGLLTAHELQEVTHGHGR